MIGLRVVTMAAVLLVAGCSPRSPEAVGDRFMDLYFLEFDQQKLLPLTMGLAKEKLETELRLVREIRSDLGTRPSAGQTRMQYRRLTAQVTADEAQLTYAVTIKSARDRLVNLALHRADGTWRVGNFTIAEGDAPGGK